MDDGVSAGMPTNILKGEGLMPEELAICQRVFDQICEDARVEGNPINREMLASTVLLVFQVGPRDESRLLANIRARRLDFAEPIDHIFQSSRPL